MDIDERFLLKEICDSARESNVSLKTILSGRVNSFILVISFVVLAEASIIACLLPLILDKTIGPLDLLVFFFISLGIILLGCGSYRIYKLFRGKLSSYLVPEDPELPYLDSSMINKDIEALTDDEKELLRQPLKEVCQGKYKDYAFIYRQWVFQQVSTLQNQFNNAEEISDTFKTAAIFVLASVIAIFMAMFVVFVECGIDNISQLLQPIPNGPRADYLWFFLFRN